MGRTCGCRSGLVAVVVPGLPLHGKAAGLAVDVHADNQQAASRLLLDE